MCLGNNRKTSLFFKYEDFFTWKSPFYKRGFFKYLIFDFVQSHLTFFSWNIQMRIEFQVAWWLFSRHINNIFFREINIFFIKKLHRFVSGSSLVSNLGDYNWNRFFLNTNVEFFVKKYPYSVKEKTSLSYHLYFSTR